MEHDDGHDDGHDDDSVTTTSGSAASDPPPRPPRTVGAALGAAMLGLDKVIFGRQREEAPIVSTASGEPGDVDTEGIVIPLRDDADIVAPPLPPTAPVVAPRRRRRLW